MGFIDNNRLQIQDCTISTCTQITYFQCPIQISKKHLPRAANLYLVFCLISTVRIFCVIILLLVYCITNGTFERRIMKQISADCECQNLI